MVVESGQLTGDGGGGGTPEQVNMDGLKAKRMPWVRLKVVTVWPVPNLQELGAQKGRATADLPPQSQY